MTTAIDKVQDIHSRYTDNIDWTNPRFDSWYIRALDDVMLELQSLPENNSQAVEVLRSMQEWLRIEQWIDEKKHKWGILERKQTEADISLLETAISRISALWDGWIPVTPESLPDELKDVYLFSTRHEIWYLFQGKFSNSFWPVTHWRELYPNPKQ